MRNSKNNKQKQQTKTNNLQTTSDEHHQIRNDVNDFIPKKPSFLGVKSVFADLKGLSKTFKWFLSISILVILVFNFVSVTPGASVFLPIQQYDQIIANGSLFGASKTAAIIGTIFYSLNGIAAFSGVLAVAMIAQNKASQYFWGLINAIFFGLFVLSVGYIGDFFMNIILILGAPLGWYLFEIAGLGNKVEKKHNWKWNLWFYLGVVIVTAFLVMMWYWMIYSATDDIFGSDNNQYHLNRDSGTDGKVLQILDGLTNGMGTTGYVMQLSNMSQQFYVWFFVNISKILKFTGVAGINTLNINMIIQFIVWFAISGVGLYKRSLQPLFKKK